MKRAKLIREISREEWLLKMLLRVIGIVEITAIAAVVMPFSWMVAIHGLLQIGTLPDMPIIGYLTRSLSALYAAQGIFILFLSLDVQRFLPILKCMAILTSIFGAVMFVIDLEVAMPWYWMLIEGPFILFLGSTILWLADRVRPDAPSWRIPSR
jgi:hypothetical protein